jgi:hypothetical protein
MHYFDFYYHKLTVQLRTVTQISSGQSSKLVVLSSWAPELVVISMLGLMHAVIKLLTLGIAGCILQAQQLPKWCP